MSKSTITVVCFDWKTVIYIYVCDNVAHNLCCQIPAEDNSSTCTFTTIAQVIVTSDEVKDTCTDACANVTDYTQSINRSFVHKAKEGRHVRIVIYIVIGKCIVNNSKTLKNLKN